MQQPFRGKDVALHHHEHYDGNGYPDHIAGMDISCHARIVSIMDAYDAMNSDRVYRKALSKDVIRKEMQNGRGGQFDPDYLDVFKELFEDGSLEKIAENHTKNMEMPQEKIPETEVQSLQELVGRLAVIGQYDGAVKLEETETPKFYEYISNFCSRYGHSFELVMITLKPAAGSMPDPARQQQYRRWNWL